MEDIHGSANSSDGQFKEFPYSRLELVRRSALKRFYPVHIPWSYSPLIPSPSINVPVSAADRLPFLLHTQPIQAPLI
jgi:hypothetical protein